MITLITYLTWPKTMTFTGLTIENLVALEKYLNGPDYRMTITLDAFVIIGIILIGVLIKNLKDE